MMQISSIPLSIASSPMIWMMGLVSPSRSTSGNISFCTAVDAGYWRRSEEHTSELQSQSNLVCRLLLEKKKKKNITQSSNHPNYTQLTSHNNIRLLQTSNQAISI